MQTVAASVILEDAYRTIGWDPDQLETRQKQIARTAMSMALQEIWESWWWAELMKCESKVGAQVYSSTTTYAAGDNVYYPATKQYYQCCQASLAQAPATLGTDLVTYTTNYAYWADAAATYSGDDYVVGVNDTGLEPGDIVRYAEDGECYQYFAPPSHLQATFTYLQEATPTSDLVSLLQTGTSGGRPYLTGTSLNDITLYLGWSAGDMVWYLATDPEGAYATQYFRSTQDVMSPDLVTFWEAGPLGYSGEGGGCSVDKIISTTYPAPPDSVSWHKLVEFIPTATAYGDIRMVALHDPRASTNPTELDHETTLEGELVHGADTGPFWIWYRRPVPILTGDEFSSTATYTATPTTSLTFP